LYKESVVVVMMLIFEWCIYVYVYRGGEERRGERDKQID
jgi:hypothetical protein